jgi:LysR family cys regulon transcriptional activator
MKLQQLRYLIEIENQALNISRAATVLCTSQSGISKQISLLEDELGVELFERNARKLTSFSAAGERILTLAKEAINKVDDIRQIAQEYTGEQESIGIATTHTQARYVLPAIVRQFLSLYPDINLNLQQGTPEQVAALLEQNEVDIAIATEVLASRETLVALPCYQWGRSVIVKRDHPLARKQILALEDIVQYPIITYVQGLTGRYRQDEVFKRYQLRPNIVLTAVDADVIKTYVRLGLGIGIIADMAFNPEQDHDLSVISVKNLFGVSTSQIAIKKERYLKPCIYPFIEMFAPHLTKTLIERATECIDLEVRKKLFLDVLIPMY